MGDIKECFLCGRNGTQDPLDLHHIFGGARRKKSERYGLMVHLCHHDCHIFGEYAVHRNAQSRELIQRYGQQKAMLDNGWSKEEFIREFGRNYMEEL